MHHFLASAPQIALLTFAVLASTTLSACSLTRSPAASENYLQRSLDQIALPADGTAGIAVIALDTNQTATRNGSVWLPQQSTFKSWIAVGVADAVERGTLSWSDQLLVKRSDLTYSYQPIAEHVPPDGRTFTVEELVRWMITLSDNPSADILLRKLGGTEPVQAALTQRGITYVRVDGDEVALKLFADGLAESVRGLNPIEAAPVIRHLLAHSPDLATAHGAARAFAALARGKLVNVDSTRRLMEMHAETTTGSGRLKAGLPPGWRIAHKTGSGADISDMRLTTNDMGIITAPDGRSFAIAVFLSGCSKTPDGQEAWIADVARTVTASVPPLEEY